MIYSLCLLIGAGLGVHGVLNDDYKLLTIACGFMFGAVFTI